MPLYVILAFTFIFSSGFSIVSTQDNVVYRQENVTVNRTVILGALIPIHTVSNTSEPCGPVQGTAIQLVEAMVLAINIINEDRNLLPNVNLSFDIRDTCTLVNLALRHSLEFVQGSFCQQETLSVSSILGAARSTVSQSVANFFSLFKIPVISYASTAAVLSNKNLFRYFFRTIPSDEYQARALVDIVIHFNWTYIIALYSDDVYGQDGIAGFRSALRNSNTSGHCIALDGNGIVLHDEPPNYEDVVNQISQIWVNNASVILLYGHSFNARGMLRVIQEKSLSDINFPLRDITWLGSDSWATSVPDDLRPMARGMISVTPRLRKIFGFDEYFTSLNPRNNPSNPWFMEYWEQIFGCSLSPGPEKCNLDDQMISPNTTNYSQFPQVSLIINAVYAVAHAIQNMIHTQCTSEDLCSEILTGGTIDGELLRQYLLNVSFNNTQEIVQFDENGDVPAVYTVLNLQRISDDQHSFKVVGSWDPENSLLITENIEWVRGDEVPQSVCSLPCRRGHYSARVTGQGDCCFRCIPCGDNAVVENDVCRPCMRGFRPNSDQSECIEIPVTYFMPSDPLGIALLTISCVGIVATIFVIVVFLIFFNHELIKASSRELSAILLSGILLCFILPFFYVIKPSPAICGIRRFLVGLGFAFSYSALLVKTNRIHRIFNRKPESLLIKPRFINPVSQIIITCVFISVQVLIAFLWLAIEHPATTIIRSRNANTLICGENRIVGIAILLFYNIILLFASTYFAFRIRKVPENFNEAKFIFGTLSTSCIAWIAFIAVYFGTIGLPTEFQTGSLALGVIVSAGINLIYLFISKVIRLFWGKKKERESREATKVSQNLSTGPHKNAVVATSET